MMKKMELYEEASKLLASCDHKRGHEQRANRNGWTGGIKNRLRQKDATYDRAQKLLAEWRSANNIKRYGEQ